MSSLTVEVSGSADAHCNRCGWFDYWHWNTEEDRPALPTACPGCEDVPWWSRWKARFAYWRAKRRGGANFLPTLWSADTREAIEFTKVCSSLVAQDDGWPGKELDQGD